MGKNSPHGNGGNGGNGNGNGNSWGMNPRKARGGLKARSERGAFAKNWWARRWIEAMERLVPVARLERGRYYAREGQVLSVDEIKNGVAARVQGSRAKPYLVTIRMRPLNNEQWKKVLDVLADRAIFAAQLLAGEMPANIEDAFAAAGVSLFPNIAGDLMTECNCPDWANPCKHVAATHYILGERFDEDPFLLFRLRGRTQETILNALRQRRSGSSDMEPELMAESRVDYVPALEADLEHFWEMGSGLQSFSVQVKAPAIHVPQLQRLGEPELPTNLTVKGELEDAYDAISQFALMVAYGDFGAPASEEE
ncbi:MAG TPA: hypothetical protein VN452_04660 [Longilinea sp.]|nr:hypothetical protein [Longilinea sp.]